MKPINKIQLEFFKKLLSSWEAIIVDGSLSKVDAALLNQSIKHMRALIQSLEKGIEMRGAK